MTLLAMVRGLELRWHQVSQGRVDAFLVVDLLDEVLYAPVSIGEVLVLSS